MLDRSALGPTRHFAFQVYRELAPACHSGFDPESSPFLLDPRVRGNDV